MNDQLNAYVRDSFPLDNGIRLWDISKNSEFYKAFCDAYDKLKSSNVEHPKFNMHIDTNENQFSATLCRVDNLAKDDFFVVAKPPF